MRPDAPPRRRHALRLLVVVAALACAGSAGAAIVWAATPSALHASAVAPPVHFVAGAQSGDATYAKAFSISANKTTFSATLRGVPHADLVLPDLLRLENPQASAQSVTITTASVAAAPVQTFRMEFLDGATVVATLDLESANPAASFTVPASTTLKVRVVLELAEGAGNHDVVAANDVRLSVSG